MTKITRLPDGSAFFTAEVMSKDEAMKLPVNKRPICFRISSEMYHAVFEHVGTASMCWQPRPSEVFSSEEASEVAVKLCFKIAEELETSEALVRTQVLKESRENMVRVREILTQYYDRDQLVIREAVKFIDDLDSKESQSGNSHSMGTPDTAGKSVEAGQNSTQSLSASSTVVCPRCKGKGEVRTFLMHVECQTMGCPECKGTGQIPAPVSGELIDVTEHMEFKTTEGLITAYRASKEPQPLAGEKQLWEIVRDEFRAIGAGDAFGEVSNTIAFHNLDAFCLMVGEAVASHVRAEQAETIANLWTALEEYGQHDSGCGLYHGGHKCDCGLSAALAKVTRQGGEATV